MSKRGEPVPEIGEALRNIADAYQKGEADKTMPYTLRRIAALFSSDSPHGQLRLHSPVGRQRGGAELFDKKLDMAKAIDDLRRSEGISLKTAFRNRDLQGRFMVGEDTLEAAWKEMRPYFNMDSPGRDLWLYFRRLEAEQPGIVKIERVKISSQLKPREGPR